MPWLALVVLMIHATSAEEPGAGTAAHVEGELDTLPATLDATSGTALLTLPGVEPEVVEVLTIEAYGCDGKRSRKGVSVELLRAAAARFVTEDGDTSGVPTLQVGRSIELGGLGPLFEGSYTAVRVRHQFDVALGLRTSFCGERTPIQR